MSILLTFIAPGGSTISLVQIFGVLTPGIMCGLLIASIRQVKQIPMEWSPWATDKPITIVERIAQSLIGLMSILGFGIGIASLILLFRNHISSAGESWEALVLVGATTKFLVIGLAAVCLALNIRRQQVLIIPLIAGS